jgi:hypothetical protein
MPYVSLRLDDSPLRAIESPHVRADLHRLARMHRTAVVGGLLGDAGALSRAAWRMIKDGVPAGAVAAAHAAWTELAS